MSPADVAVVSPRHSAVRRRPSRRGLLVELASEIRAAAVATLAVAMVAAGGFVAFRRLAGSLTTGLSVGGMLVVVLAMLACVAACDWLGPPATAIRGSSTSRLGPKLLPRMGMLLCLWGVAGSGSPSASTGLAVLGGLAAIASLATPSQLGSLGEALRAFSWPQIRRSQARGRPAPAAFEPLHPQPHSLEGFLQQQVRQTTVSGGERVCGTVLVSFRTGDRLAVAHVGFCPPLQETPAVQLSTAYDELDAVVAAGEVLPWGIRIECRLEEAAEEPFDIPVDFVASSTRLPRERLPAPIPPHESTRP